MLFGLRFESAGLPGEPSGLRGSPVGSEGEPSVYSILTIVAAFLRAFRHTGAKRGREAAARHRAAFGCWDTRTPFEDVLRGVLRV